MVKERFTRFQSKLSSLISEAQQIVDEDMPRDFENKRAYTAIEKLKDDMELALYELKYISKPVIEGKLSEMEYGKFELINRSGESVAIFSCGSRIEVYDPEEAEWHIGRVEHGKQLENDTEGYYFCCHAAGNPYLYTGMRARIRPY